MRRQDNSVGDVPRTLSVHTLTSLPSSNLTSGVQHGSVGNVSNVSNVYQEQYCMCKPRTTLERRLVLVVIALSLLIVGLLIGLTLALARHNPDVPEGAARNPTSPFRWFLS